MPPQMKKKNHHKSSYRQTMIITPLFALVICVKLATGEASNANCEVLQTAQAQRVAMEQVTCCQLSANQWLSKVKRQQLLTILCFPKELKMQTMVMLNILALFFCIKLTMGESTNANCELMQTRVSEA
uniref:Uncharacterized protein n=1 Tax=Romanomermis culicivorax TaxID=13658 RepID=A0A915HL38_ROMCU